MKFASYVDSSSSGVSACSFTSTGSYSASSGGAAAAFNMKHFIKSRTASITNNKNSSSNSSNNKNPVIVHLSMQQGQQQAIPHPNLVTSHPNIGVVAHSNAPQPPMPANISGATQAVINNDHQIYLNPSDLCYPPPPSELPDPARHQFEPPVIPLASSVTPRNSGGGQPAYHPSQGVVSPNNPSAVQNYGVISTEVTPQATPIAAKKLTSGSSGGSSACFSNYMPMSECSSQNTNDSGRGTHEQMTLPPGNNAADASLESSFFEENLYDRKYRHQIKAKQQKVRKYWKDRSSHQRRSRRLGRSLSASSLSTVDHNGRKVHRSKERRTYKVYDGDYLTKPGNANAFASEDDGIGGGGGLGEAPRGGVGGGGKISHGNSQHQRSSSKPGVVGRLTTRTSKHEASEHTDMNDSNYEKERSSGGQMCSCQCEQTLDLVARKIEHLKLAILQRLEYSVGSSDRQMEEIDRRVRQHLNSLDKLVKDRIGNEKVEAVQRMDKRMLQERMAFAEEIRKTEMRVDRSLKDWCDSRYQRVDSRIQGSSDRAHSDSGLSRRHSFGEASSIDTGTESVCKYYRDSGAFECSSTASNSDVGGKTPSDSFPVRTPWNNRNSQTAGMTQQQPQHKESPLVSEKMSHSATRPLNSSTPLSKSGSGTNSITPPPVIPSSTGFSVPGRQATKSESISDILDQHIDNNYTLNHQQYGTIRRKNRPRLETSSTNFDENESCFGDNESVSQIPILTLPSESMAKMNSSSSSGGSQQQHRSHSTSVHHRTSSGLPVSSFQQQQQQSFAASHQSSSGGSSNSSPASNVFRKIDSQVADMNEDLRQFNSQYLNRQSGHGGKNSTNHRATALFDDKPNAQPPPVDFERMKRLDSSSGGGGGVKCPSKIPPVVPPRGLDMTRGSSGPSNSQSSTANQNPYGNKGDPEDREALQNRIKELEEVLHRYTNPGPVTKAI